jgi:hypothetical protein
VLICDKTTDGTLLDQILRAAWARASLAGTARRTGPLAMVTVERNSRLELDAVMQRLLGDSEPQRAPA